jgi:subtilisin family serine protease
VSRDLFLRRAPLLLLALATPAAAAPLDPLLSVPSTPPVPFLPALSDTRPMAAVISLPATPSAAELDALAARGFLVRRDDGGAPVCIGSTCAGDGLRPALRRLAHDGYRIRLARPMAVRPPAGTEAATETDALQAAYGTPLSGPHGTGTGSLIFDADSGVDVFHPHFFRADGGAFAFLDVDGDGALTPDVDGLDADGDGEIAEDETLRLLDTIERFADPLTYLEVLRGRGFDPSMDWLYLDLDGNGRRDFGPDAGFSDDDPGFGEPLYVPDDADGDGVLGADERLVRLGTSSIHSVRAGSHIYRRGDDLSDLQLVAAGTDTSHGTGVLGALLGGQLFPQARPRGLLPDAEALLFDYDNSDAADWIEALDWARDEGATAMLYESGQWIGVTLDGDDLIDDSIGTLASEDGIPQICPGGNLADSGKHGVVESEDGTVTFRIRAAPGVAENVSYLAVDLHAAPVDDLACTWTTPDGVDRPVPFDGNGDPIGGMASWGTHAESARGSAIWELMLWDGALPPGTHMLRCAFDGADRRFDAYLEDGSGWSRGTVFLEESAAGTMCNPSTADHCIAVAAYGAQGPYWSGERAGERHLYSAIGPRIDGARTMDVAAPADPFSPVPSDEVESSDSPEYTYFSGTSGAGPHVAAVAAMLKALDPEADGLEIRDWIRDGARVDEFVSAETSTFPDDAWGYGKLSAYRAEFGEAAPALPRPLGEVLPVLLTRWEGERCVVDASVDLEAGVARWDVGYDGFWDGDFGPGFGFDVEPGSTVLVRMQAGWGGAYAGGSATRFTVPAQCEVETACGGGCAGGGAAILLVVPMRARRRARR